MRDLLIYGLMLAGYLCVAWYFATCNKHDRNQYADDGPQQIDPANHSVTQPGGSADRINQTQKD